MRHYYKSKKEKEFNLSIKEFNKITAPILKLKSNFKIVKMPKTTAIERAFILLEPCGNIYVTTKHNYKTIGNIFKDRLKEKLLETKEFNKKEHVTEV